MKNARVFVPQVLAEATTAALASLAVFLSLPACCAGVSAAPQDWSILGPPPSAVEVYDIQPVYGAIYLTSYDSDAIYRVWRYTDAAKWQVAFDSRTSVVAGLPITQHDPALRKCGIEASPEGDALYLFNHNRTEIWRSVDSGANWFRLAMAPHQASYSSAGAMLVLDANTLVLAAANPDTVAITFDAGISWMNSDCPVGTVMDLEAAPGGDLIAAGVDEKTGTARIAVSSNMANTWEVIPTPVPFEYATEVYAAVPPDYAASRRIAVTGVDADEAADSGIWEWAAGTSSAWRRLDGAQGTGRVELGYGLVAGPGNGIAGNPDEGSGIIYAADYRDGSVSRVRGSALQAESIAGIPGGYFTGLWYLARTGELYALGSDYSIYRYTDMLNRPGAEVQVSEPALEGTTDISWQALNGAENYKLVINSESPYTPAQTSFYTAASAEGVVIEYDSGDTRAVASGLRQNTRYYVTVWASSPVSSFAFPVAEFTTPLVEPVPPAVTTGTATGMNAGQATLNGTLESTGSAGSVLVYFEYGATTGYGFRTEPQTMNAAGPFSAAAAGFSAGATYHFRAVAEHADGSASAAGLDAAFTLPAATTQPTSATQPPTSTLPAVTVATSPATGLDGGGSAVLNGNLVSLEGAEAVTVYFEYGATTAYGFKTTPQTMTAAGPFSATVSGLEAGTTYHFRAVAEIPGAASIAGLDTAFVLAADGTPEVATAAATSIEGDSAVLNGVLRSLGGAASVTVYFEYGATAELGTETPPQTITATGSFSAVVNGLEPGSTCYF
ncbi:MAG: hypothetical protein JW954_06530, partial [Dehalococcoidaceae bacterium]|nr:hypothetical protein [Dehalococcoidaceae bacterium]